MFITLLMFCFTVSVFDMRDVSGIDCILALR
jgi:hypothetical protein